MTDHETIAFELRDAVAIVTLAQPATLNAASIRMVEELMAAIEKAGSRARCLVITGQGRAFCSGADLSSDLNPNDPGYDAGRALDTHYNPLMQLLRQLPIPVVTAVNGPAAGIGASIALSGDLIVAAETSYFLQAFRNIGLVPDGGSAFLLVKSAGRARASEMLLLGERVAAATALEWGMVNRVVAPGALLDTALGLATSLAEGPTRALAQIRRLCWAATELSFTEMVTAEREAQRDAGRNVDHREGVAAFLGKRRAAFSGN